MAVIGCYSLDLYCDVGGSEYYGSLCPNHRGWLGGAQGQFTGKTERACLKQARLRGWKFYANATKATCPKCTKEGRKP